MQRFLNGREESPVCLEERVKEGPSQMGGPHKPEHTGLEPV